MKKIRRLLVFLILLAFLVVLTSRSQSIILQTVAVIFTGIISCIINPIAAFVDTKGQGIKIWYQSQIKYRDKEVYLSFSYLYKIELEGSYLFIRGNRLKDRYQPVGGVYKYYDEAKNFLGEINALPSVKMQNKEDSDDLRLTIKGENYLTFIEWFLSMTNREYDPLREFNEEMIKSGLLPEEKFEYIEYRKIRTHNVGFTYSTPLQMPEVVYADIFELKLNSEQKRALIDAVHEHPDMLCLATSEEIKRRRVNGAVEMNLGNNAPWIIGED